MSTRWLTGEQQKVWRTYLLGAARLNARLEADLQRSGLDLPEYEILVHLEESPERRRRMSELADAVHQSRSRLTHTIARMEKAGLVVRTTCPTDRRGVWAELTDGGFKVLAAAAPGHVAAVRRHLVDAVAPEDWDALGRVFAAVLAVPSDDTTKG